MSLDERKQRGADLIERLLGADDADQMRAAWRDVSPELEEYITEFVAGEIWSRPQLDARTKSLVTIATLAGIGRPLALELNIRMARNAGATEREVIETLLHIAPYAGFPAA
jgi:4-carboxymuconolactone decarboxylase|tara:strand:+ start:164 stop:496 length:333 start_codon:yes stop_codon:yes gene_type:complete